MSKAAGKLRRRGGDMVTDAALHKNTHYSKPLFGPAHGYAPVSHTAGSERAGQMYRVGLTPDGRVVHLYQDGTRIVLPKAKHPAASPTNFGGMAAPESADNAALQAQVHAAHAAKRTLAQDQAMQAALAAAMAHLSGA